jgi:hypothetical protein
MLERRLLSKQRSDFGDIIHHDLRALGLGRFDCRRFLAGIRLPDLRAGFGGFFAGKARWRRTPSRPHIALADVRLHVKDYARCSRSLGNRKYLPGLFIFHASC